MLPVLFSVANFPITSFGLFLTLAILAALFTVWRAAQVYEIDPEKLLDIFFLTIFSSFIFARLYFVLFHPEILSDPFKILLINRYPGLSFWGGLLGGGLALRLFARRFKANLWQVFDFAMVGLFLGLSIGNIGCLLGSCGYGVMSDSNWAVSQAGVIGSRFPIQAIEVGLFFILFLLAWKNLLKFHFAGSVLAKGAIWLGFIKFGLEFWRGETQNLPYLPISFGFIWSILSVMGGVFVYYRQSKRSFRLDLRYLITLPINFRHQQILLASLKRSCYNAVIALRFGLKNWRRNLLRSLNIKSNPRSF
jgi:phosphatidylglycerol---prolipoprotein diacylglyceryl transferase